MEIVKTEAEERTFVQKLVDTAWPDLHPVVGQVLGRGGQAIVYKLVFADGRSEALKVIDTSVYRDPARRKDANRRGRSEIRYQKQLSDKTDTVCKLYDFSSIFLSCERGQDTPMCFLLRMELLTPLDPKNLAALDPANREKAVLQIMRDVLEGLCQTEDAGIVHRDVKCGNILLRHDPATGQSRFVLSDFGLARPFHTRTDRSFFTVCGSSDHIAPEIIRRGKLIAGRSDIYSAGVMLFHLLFPENDDYFDPAAFRQNTTDFLFSSEIKKLLFSLTEVSPASRPSPAVALIEVNRLLMQRDAAYFRCIRQQLLSDLAQSRQPAPELMAAMPEGEAAHLLRACSAALADNTHQMAEELLRGAAAQNNSGCALYYLAVLFFQNRSCRQKAAELFRLSASRGYLPACSALKGEKTDSASFLSSILLAV